MQIIFKCVFAAVLATLPTITMASIASPSFSCTSNLVFSFDGGYQASCDGDFSFDSGSLLSDTFISITANGLLSVGEQAILTAPNIRLSASDVIVQGKLNALGGTIEINSTNSVELSQSAIVDIGSSVLPRPATVNNYWSGPLADPPRGSTVDLIPRVITISNSDTLASGSLVLGGSGIRPQTVQSVQQGGQIVLLDSTTGSALQLSVAGLPSYSVAVSQVPEPSSLTLLSMGLFCIGMVLRRKSKH